MAVLYVVAVVAVLGIVWLLWLCGCCGCCGYSRLSRKRPLLVHGKMVAYERWSLTGTINEISPKLYPSTNNNYYIKLLPSLVKIRQIDKAVSIKTNSFWVLTIVATGNLISWRSYTIFP